MLDVDSSSDEESLLDEDLEQSIKDNLDGPLTLPTPCPVCSLCTFATKRFRNFTDFKALHQHADGRGPLLCKALRERTLLCGTERVRDRCRQQKKVRHFHETLRRQVEEKLTDAKVAVAVSADVPSVVGRDNVSSEATRKLDDMLDLDRSVQEGKRAIEDLQNQRQKKQRQTHRNVSRLEELRHSIREYRESAERVREESMKEIEKYGQSLSDLRDAQNQELAVRRAQIDRIERELRDFDGKLTQKQRQEMWEKQQIMLLSSQEMQRQKEEVEQQLQELQTKKASAMRNWEEAGRQKHVFETQAQLLDEQIKESTVLKEEEKLVIKQISLLGLNASTLPQRCQKCQKPFQKKDDKDGKEETCERIILEHCGCVDYCSSCVAHRRFRCQKHNLPAGDAIPFRTFG